MDEKLKYENYPVFFMINKHIAIIVGLIIFVTALSGCTSDSLASFQGPSYIPANYHSTNNTTVDNGKLFTYQGKGQLNFFTVVAAKDPNQAILKNLNSSIQNAPTENVKTTNENLTINGHQVSLKIQTIKIVGTSLSTFETSWNCPNSGLTVASVGVVPTSDLTEIKKMLQSIKCH